MKGAEEGKGPAGPGPVLIIASLSLLLLSLFLFIYLPHRNVPDWKVYSRACLEKRAQALNLKKKEIQYLLSRRDEGEEGARLREEMESLKREEGRALGGVQGVKPLAVPLIKEGGAMEERCLTCHRGVADPLLLGEKVPCGTHPGPEPLLSAHPPEEVGCYPCHGGNPPSLNARSAHRGGERPFFGGDEAWLSCYSCHDWQERLAGAQILNQGRSAFLHRGCANCHPIPSPLLEGVRGTAPHLGRPGERVKRGFLAKWIQNPGAIHLSSKMPSFPLMEGFGEEELDALVDYLMERRGGEEMGPVKISKGGGTIDRGKDVIEKKGCLACHIAPTRNGMAGSDFALPLTKVKEWLRPEWVDLWLSKDPYLFDDRRMPDMDISPGERRAILSALYEGETPEGEETEGSLKGEGAGEGRGLFIKRGCSRCHDTGVEQRLPGRGFEILAPERWKGWGGGGEDMAEAVRDVEGLIERGGRPGGRDRLSNLIYSLLRHGMERGPGGEAPHLRLSLSEVRGLTLFLGGVEFSRFLKRSGGERRNRVQGLEREKGALLMEIFNCMGCHSGGGAGLYGKAPLLQEAAGRLNFEFLAAYLLSPFRVRERLDSFMPRFPLSSEEVRLISIALSEEGSSLSGEVSRMIWKGKKGEGAPDRERVERGKEIFLNHRCDLCHGKGDEVPDFSSLEPPLPLAADLLEEGWRMAPSLTLFPERVKEDFALSLLLNPAATLKGVAMPDSGLTEEEAGDIIYYLKHQGMGAAKGGRAEVKLRVDEIEWGVPAGHLPPLLEEEVSIKDLMDALGED